tara:strand:- start:285 stop:470 length:186 start_codon:yes stop_codon:yes gene_type:complete
MKKEYLDKKDIFKMTGISIATLNRWIHLKKNIPFIKAGKRVLYDPKDVKSFMNANKVIPNN